MRWLQITTSPLAGFHGPPSGLNLTRHSSAKSSVYEELYARTSRTPAVIHTHQAKSAHHGWQMFGA